jgi:hypothetical protein
LNDKAGIGIVALTKQEIAPRHITLFGTDRQHAQRGGPQQMQGGDAIQESYVIVDRHTGAGTGTE